MSEDRRCSLGSPEVVLPPVASPSESDRWGADSRAWAGPLTTGLDFPVLSDPPYSKEGLHGSGTCCRELDPVVVQVGPRDAPAVWWNCPNVYSVFTLASCRRASSRLFSISLRCGESGM